MTLYLGSGLLFRWTLFRGRYSDGWGSRLSKCNVSFTRGQCNSAIFQNKTNPNP